MWIWLEQKHLNVIQTSCCLDPDVSCVLLSDYDNIIYELQKQTVLDNNVD